MSRRKWHAVFSASRGKMENAGWGDPQRRALGGTDPRFSFCVAHSSTETRVPLRTPSAGRFGRQCCVDLLAELFDVGWVGDALAVQEHRRRAVDVDRLAELLVGVDRA